MAVAIKHLGVVDLISIQEEESKSRLLISTGAAVFTRVLLLQYYADDTPQDDPEDFDANRAALGLRNRPRQV